MQVAFTNGNATFNLQSIKVDAAVKMKLHNPMDNFDDWLSLLPRGKPLTCCSVHVSSIVAAVAELS